ncbi:B12-binding domain-containing radical SAM protein [candidate division CSSED10-310 bacterium]|uniref:B12-binding domain-containing radical SAM protein n=1 Tax=candidate division CSSED10-310 bacterium TaxID=2855610 RepID=A0ABV6Z0Z4_UNCC1
MNLLLVYPRWRKLERQVVFHLPPHGPVVFAATLDEDIEVTFVDENVETLDLDVSPDMVAISMMLTAQLPRAFEIAAIFRKRNIPVIAGGIATMLHSEEVGKNVDSIFLGEAEDGHVQKLFQDFTAGELKPVYNFLHDFPAIETVGTARRDILKRELYNHKGMQMFDLIHASRGCHFNCYPCCTPFLGGRKFRPRPIEKVIQEIETIDNNRLFFVDNSMAQDKKWEEELFKALIPLKKKWVCHPIEEDDDILDLAYQAGCWYVYQAVVDMSDLIRNRIKRYHDHGIAVEGTIILGMDNHDIDYIKRLIDFLLEIELELAEFTILTPFSHTPARRQLEREGRILIQDPALYTGDRVVFQPLKLTITELQDMYYYAWETFYQDISCETAMADMYMRVIRREMADGSFKRSRRRKQKFKLPQDVS